jgi:beta-lactamase superfamily II metal-dependent hydrolase
MTCEITFLPVGNADSIIVKPENGAAVIIDLPDFRPLIRWFDRKQENHISRIYITHAHKDHFAPLTTFVNFLENWIQVGGRVDTLCFPDGVLTLRAATDKVKSNRDEHSRDSQRKDPLEDTLLKLKRLTNTGLKILSANRDDNPYEDEFLHIRNLHPSAIFLAQKPGKHNVTSLVQRVTYGKFSALLLADLEGEGITDLLEVTDQLPTELKAQVVKIPHHGGYPKNGNELKVLLEKIDPEIAILSVGSTNRYGHVVPDLFSLLVNLKNDQSKQLRQFICTEVTKACACSAIERIAMKKNQGLSSRKLCAGEITIVAETSGKFTVKTETNHSQEIAQINYAACDGRADL